MTPVSVCQSQLELTHCPFSSTCPPQDSVYVLASAINQMTVMNETITESPKNCEDSGVLWDSGKMIFQYLKTRNIRGDTGQVAFDDNGDRIYAEYEVVNTREDKKSTVIGRFFYHTVIQLSTFHNIDICTWGEWIGV